MSHACNHPFGFSPTCRECAAAIRQGPPFVIWIVWKDKA